MNSAKHITQAELVALEERKLPHARLSTLVDHFIRCHDCRNLALSYRLFKEAPPEPEQEITAEAERMAWNRLESTVESLRILHLSDLHFGHNSRFCDRNPEEVAELLAADLRVFYKQTHIPGAIDVAIVTGDLAERATNAEFQQAFRFFDKLSEVLDLPRSHFIFTPGNHDISWPSCKKVYADQEIEQFDTAELGRRLGEAKLSLYYQHLRSFLQVDSISQLATTLEGGGWLYNYPKLNLSIAALNSCEKETHLPQDHCGELSLAQAKSLMDKWRTPAFDDWVKIAAIHHNPEVVPQNGLEWWLAWFKEHGIEDRDLVEVYFGDIAGFRGKDFLKAISEDTRIQLVLHGHQHSHRRKIWGWRHGGGQSYVISAGSLGLVKGVLPRAEPPSLGFIQMDLGRQKLKAFRLPYIEWGRSDGELRDGAFTIDPQEPQGWEMDLHIPGLKTKRK